MKAITCVSVAALGMAISGWAAAAPPAGAATPDAAAPAPQPPDCWIEHTQVQPARARAKAAPGEAVEIGVKDVIDADKHLGAEHWTPAMQRACSSQRPNKDAPDARRTRG